MVGNIRGKNFTFFKFKIWSEVNESIKFLPVKFLASPISEIFRYLSIRYACIIWVHFPLMYIRLADIYGPTYICTA